jgi:FtsZ-interacting cell division protein ZipA
MSAQTQTTRRTTFNSSLKHSEDHFKLMVKVLTHLADSVEGQTFDGLWELVSSKPVEYYRRHFRRENKRTNPLASIKRPRTAYTFFTSERRNAIKEGNPDKGFGEISQLLAVEWHALSDKKRATYVKREQADKVRYETAKAELMAQQGDTAAPAEVPVETPAPVEETPKPAPAKKAKSAASKGAKKSAKKGGRRK